MPSHVPSAPRAARLRRLRRTLPAVAVAVLAAAVAVLVRDGGPAPRPGPPAARSPEEAPRGGGTLRVALAEDAVLDPQRGSRPASWFFARAVHRGLMAFPGEPHPAGSRPVPDLAEGEPRVSADGRTYTFRLRAGTRFGPPASRAVRAADVRAGIERLLRMRTVVSEYFHVLLGADRFLAGRDRTLRGVATPDARTVVVRVAAPANDLFWMLAHPQASAIPAELGSRLRVRPDRIAGAGPYHIARYEPERRIRLERNVEWSEAADPVRAAHVDAIDAAVAGSPAAADERVASGGADVAADVPPLRSTRGSGSVLVTAPSGCVRYLWLNTRVRPFGSTRVRRAIAAAVDRAPVATVAAAALPTGVGLPLASGVLPPLVVGSAVPREAAAAGDPGAARDMLARAEFPRGFATELVVGDTDEDRGQAAAVRRALGRAGIAVRVRAVPAASLYPDYYERAAAAVPMGLATWCADWPGLGGRTVIAALLDERRVRPAGGTVYSGIRDRALRRAIDAALRPRSEPEARRRWRAADGAAARAAAVIPLVWPQEAARLSPRVRGAMHPLLARPDPANLWLDG